MGWINLTEINNTFVSIVTHLVLLLRNEPTCSCYELWSLSLMPLGVCLAPLLQAAVCVCDSQRCIAATQQVQPTVVVKPTSSRDSAGTSSSSKLQPDTQPLVRGLRGDKQGEVRVQQST